MKKKLLIILLALTMFFSGMAGTAMAAGLDNFKAVKTYTQGQFADVSSSVWYAVNVKEAYEYDLINGKDSRHFDPNGNLTVAEAIKLAACLNSIYYNGSINISTTGAAVWYQPYVDYAKAQGIISKDFDNYNRAATRLEFGSIFAKAMPSDALAKINTVEDDAIPDLPMASNGADGVYTLYRAGILTGNDAKGTFTPNSNIARSEAAAITTRMANTSLRRSITLIKGSTSGSLTAEQIAAQCSPAVFYLEVYDRSGKATASGSGFFINSNGMAVTNYHVIEGASSAKISTTDGKVYNVSGVYDYDKGRDIALLKIDGSGFSYLTADKSNVANGMTIFAIGSPKGWDNTISQGLVSNANRVINGYSFIQISAPISHGSSGGALLNTAGKVIGITSAGVDEAQNLNFAIPISAIDSLSRTNVTPLANIAGGSFETKPVVSKSEITVNAGSTATVMVTSTHPDCDTISYDFIGISENYVDCEWGEWNGDDITLYIKGLAEGTAKIKIYECDESGNKISGDTYITINVKAASSGNSYAYYSGYYPAVDLGNLIGIAAESAVTNGTMKMYAYSLTDINRVSSSDTVVKKYTAALEKSGFKYYYSFDDEDGFPVLVYRNSQYGVLVYLGMDYDDYDAYMLVAVDYE